MSQLPAEHMTILKRILEKEFIAHLPPPSNIAETFENNPIKFLSRAFSAFALHKLCKISQEESSKSVVDDFDDFGIDAIYYDSQTKTLYFVQTKLKESEEFKKEEAEAFVRGLRKIIAQDFDDFNANVKVRKTEIIGALEICDQIKIVVAYTGSRISDNARSAIEELLADRTHGEERFSNTIVEFNAEQTIISLQEAHAYKQVDTRLCVHECTRIEEPKLTYFGLINLGKLVELYSEHGEALYERNVRTFLGQNTDVNVSIQCTLAESPENFVYLNNGITVLCQEITPRNTDGGTGKYLDLAGISIINGAQTISSAAKFLADNASGDISRALVSITLIKADADGAFGESVTRARNHQNEVKLSDFVALDAEQERLRREIALLGINYVYKATGADRVIDDNQIYVDEAAQALPALSNDARYPVYLKNEPLQLLNRDSDKYKTIFSVAISPFQIVNAVRFNRYVQRRMAEEANSCSGQETLIYRNGNYVFAWVLAKRIIETINSIALVEDSKLRTELSEPFDRLRLAFLEETQRVISGNSASAFFKNQAQVKNLIKNVMIRDFGIALDDGLRRFEAANPDEFFKFLISRAPQIENLV